MSSQLRDFSYFSLFTAGLACFAPLTAAYTQPTGDGPVGNAFSAPGLDSVVPVGQPYTVTWTPSTSGTVTLVLLKGPSSNAVPQYAIVEHLANTGTYSWTPATDLVPTGTTGYGIELIDDATGAYQYTTQFGISNPAYSNNDTDSSSASTSSATALTTSTSLAITTTTATDGNSSTATLVIVTSTIASSSSTSSSDQETITSSAPMTTSSAGVARNGTVNTPTGGIIVLTSTKTGTATGSATPSTTGNAAANVVGSFGAVVVAAGLAVLCA